MKPFRFRADTLLSLRRRRRDAARIELAQAQQLERQSAEDLASKRAQRDVAENAHAEAIRVGGEVELIERHRNWRVFLDAEVDRSRQRHQEQAERVVRLAEALTVVHRDVRVLERLRERLWRRYLDAVRRQEMKELDEIATLRYARRLTEGGMHRDG